MYKNRFVNLSLIVTYFANLPLIFEKLPLVLIIVATHFHSYSVSGCEIWAPPTQLGLIRSRILKNFVGKSTTYECLA